MNRFVPAISLIACIALAGCGSSGGSDKGGATAAGAGGATATTSRYDTGSRAGQDPIDESRVAAGEELFKTKGCSACHAFGHKLSCPDLDGVTMRRTAQWMEHQILHPDVMVKEDPISHQLFAQFALQMPNQGLTADEAKSVIEFLKHKNHETVEAHKED